MKTAKRKGKKDEKEEVEGKTTKEEGKEEEK